jgi:hypothetical protein
MSASTIRRILPAVAALACTVTTGCSRGFTDPVPCIVSFIPVVEGDTLAPFGSTVQLAGNEELAVLVIAGTTFDRPSCGGTSGPRIFEFDSSPPGIINVVRTSDTTAVIRRLQVGTANFFAGWSFNHASLRFRVNVVE